MTKNLSHNGLHLSRSIGISVSTIGRETTSNTQKKNTALPWSCGHVHPCCRTATETSSSTRKVLVSMASLLLPSSQSTVDVATSSSNEETISLDRVIPPWSFKTESLQQCLSEPVAEANLRRTCSFFSMSMMQVTAIRTMWHTVLRATKDPAQSTSTRKMR